MVAKLQYNKARNFANKTIEKEKNNYLRTEINKNKQNPKQLWQLINKITGKVTSSLDNLLLSAFEKKLKQPIDIANGFAQTFSKNVKNILPKCDKPVIKNNYYRNPINVSMRLQKPNIENIEKIIKSLRSDKAPGIDGIRAIDVKAICNKLSPVIAKLINMSIQTGKYPEQLKTGVVRPIFKKGSRLDFDNYRPITILSTINKIFEKYLCNQIHKYYKCNNVITDKQYGFQPRKSTIQLLSKFTNSVNKHLNDRKHVFVAFIDYSKAFDTLRHDTLIERLEDCGIRGSLLQWCQDYLANRSYLVKVGDAFSNKVTVTEGTAQGSVLGPLHYLTYVNNLPNTINQCEIYQFADDTCLLAADDDHSKALQMLQNDFTTLTKWSHDAGLVLNANKTKVMYVSSSKNRSKQKVNIIVHDHNCLHRDTLAACKCNPVELVNKQTYLGLVIDDRFKWTEHIKYVCDKLRALLAKFTIIKHKIPYAILLLLYKSLGESIISYGLSSYGLTFKTHLNAIYELQLRILKIIVPRKIKEYFKEDYRNLFSYCKIIPIHEKVKYMVLQENYFKRDLQIKPVHHKMTRGAANPKLITPRYNNSYGKNRLDYKIPQLVNELPNSLITSLNTKNLKTKLIHYFLQTNKDF